MGFFDIFGKKTVNESNAVFGQQALGNQLLLQSKGIQTYQSQITYVTTGSSTNAGRPVDVTMLTRNSTVMSCIAVKARALSQLPIRVVSKSDDGTYVDAIESDKVGKRDQAKAKQVYNLLNNPNNFQSQYEFWNQFLMWLDLSGETFTLWWRKNQDNPTETPLEMYILDSSLIAVRITDTRYPIYQMSTPSYGFNKDQPLASHQVMHCKEMAWQGSSGFNKAILAAELVALDQDIDLYANYIMLNGAKPSGMFITDQVVPDAKYKEIAARLKEAWSAMVGSKQSDPSKPGQSMLLDQGMKYEKIDMLNLQDTDAANLKMQTMKRICGLFGVPSAMIGITDSKYNNTQTMLDEFYKSTMYPLIVNIQQKLKSHLLQGYPNLNIEFDTRNFLKGAPLDQMNYVVAGVNAGIITPNEAREYMNMPHVSGGDELSGKDNKQDAISGSSAQDTGGGGGNQTRKMNIGTK